MFIREQITDRTSRKVRNGNIFPVGILGEVLFVGEWLVAHPAVF